MSIFRRFGAYTSHPDPLGAMANLFAIVLGGNQPFYPLYLFLLFGWVAWPSLIGSVVAFALYALVPLVMRRSSLMGRIFMCLSSDFHVLLSAAILGEASGVMLFFAPCIMQATLLFRGRERWLMLPLGALPIIIYFCTAGHFPQPLLRLDDAQYATLFTLNAVSMGILIGFMGYNFAWERELAPAVYPTSLTSLQE